MFGQIEKDGWELMEWVKEAEEATQLGSSDTLHLSILLFIPLCSFPRSLILPSIKALIRSENLSATHTQRLALCEDNPNINPEQTHRYLLISMANSIIFQQYISTSLEHLQTIELQIHN